MSVTDRRLRTDNGRRRGYEGRRRVLTCVVAQALPLLPAPVEPDAEAHEDDPAGAPDSGDEGGLLDHVGDLLRDAVVAVAVDDHVLEGLACQTDRRS